MASNVVDGVLKVFNKEATAELLKEVKEAFHIHGCDEATELVLIAKEILIAGGAKLKSFHDQIKANAAAKDAFNANVELFAKIGCQLSNGGTNYGKWTAAQIKWCADNLDSMRQVVKKGLGVPSIGEKELESALILMEVDGGKLNETSVTLAIEKCVFKASAVDKEADVSKLQRNSKLFHAKDSKATNLTGASMPKANTRNLAEALIFFYQYQEQHDAKFGTLASKSKFVDVDIEYNKQLQLKSQIARVIVNKEKAKAKKAKKERFGGVDIKLADKRKDRESQADGTPGAFEDITPEYLASIVASKKDGLTLWCNEWAKSGKLAEATPEGKVVELRYTDPENDMVKKITNLTELITFLTTTLEKFVEAPSVDLHMRWGLGATTGAIGTFVSNG